MAQPTEEEAPDLSNLEVEEYAELLHQVAKIDAEATEQTGH